MSTTTRTALTKMDDSDKLADVALKIRQLADQIDVLLPLSGQASVAVVGSAVGWVTVTFPASYFAATPRVVATVNGDSNYYAVVTNVVAASFRAYVVRASGATATATINVDWVAVK